MSVPASRRSQSSMEYVHNWRKFCGHLNRWAAHLPKRYAFRMVNPMIDHAHEAMYDLNAANRTYVTDEVTFSVRRSHLIKADAHIDHVETILEIIYEVAVQDAYERQQRGDRRVKFPNEHAYEQFADAIEKQRRLIAGVKANDTKRFDKMEQDVGSVPQV